jgi:hypothetical protein
VHCCSGSEEVAPTCSGTTYVCPVGTMPMTASCVPGTDV